MRDPSPPPMASPEKKRKKGKNKRSRRDDEDLVSSSSQQEPGTRVMCNAGTQTKGSLRKSEMAMLAEQQKILAQQEFKQIIEKMRADFDQEKKRAVNVATRSLERDLERLKGDHATELEELGERHKQEISENKRKQWVRLQRRVFLPRLTRLLSVLPLRGGGHLLVLLEHGLLLDRVPARALA